MIERRFSNVCQQLQGRKPHMPHFLNEVYLDGIRGIEGLKIIFDYPVSVIAGGNATGKSTVLFAAACAYKPPDAGPRDYVPSTLFPDFRPRRSRHHDHRDKVLLRFEYSTPDGRQSMQWKRGKGWNRSFLGRKHARQPERPLYLRTLSNLSNPSEVRGVLTMSLVKAALEETPLTASQVGFAQQVLRFRYSEVVDLASGKKKLLFATQDGGAEYSELHMAAGERAILRLSQEIAQLRGALVLIDEIEAGLHPWVQQLPSCFICSNWLCGGIFRSSSPPIVPWYWTRSPQTPASFWIGMTTAAWWCSRPTGTWCRTRSMGAPTIL
ncbi:hypothetical protein [Candidatus Palauibacter sp.]|uniref:hypothetical protein n=1 Tax=Candidatus Palauibacter sp. TaxID=3101350 RepID=UPI003B5169E6